VLVLPAPVCLADDTSPLEGFRALVYFPSWLANRPAAQTPPSFSACCPTASDPDVLRPAKGNHAGSVFVRALLLAVMVVDVRVVAVTQRLEGRYAEQSRLRDL